MKAMMIIKSPSAPFRPVCSNFEIANFWGKLLGKLRIGPLESLEDLGNREPPELRGLESAFERVLRKRALGAIFSIKMFMD